MSSLQERIAARLDGAIHQQVMAGFEVPGCERGMAAVGPDGLVMVLSVDDVARIAADVIERPF